MIVTIYILKKNCLEMSSYDSDEDDYLTPYSRTSKIEEDVTILIKRDDSGVYYDAWDAKWAMAPGGNWSEIDLSATRNNCRHMEELIVHWMTQKGVDASSLTDGTTAFIQDALTAPPTAKEVRNQTIVTKDVFSSTASTTIAALADLASQMDKSYKDSWKSMKNSIAGVRISGVTHNLEKIKESSQKKVVVPHTTYTLAIFRAPPTSASVEKMGHAVKRQRLEAEIVSKVEESLEQKE